MTIEHPLPAGARVHHRGGIYSLGYSAQHVDDGENGGYYWGTIVDVLRGNDGEPLRFPDGAYEYKVLRDAPLISGGQRETHWASYHIDRARV